MKQLQLVTLAGALTFLISCETTQTASTGNQEQKRLAQIKREQHEAAQYDESDINLWNAHQDEISKGTSPMIPYTPLAQH
jgi:hypothetical protein